MRKITLYVPLAVGQALQAQFTDFPALISLTLTSAVHPVGHCQLELVVPDACFNQATDLIKASEALNEGVSVSVALASVAGCGVAEIKRTLGTTESEAVNWDEVVEAIERETAPGLSFLMFVSLASILATCGLIVGSIPVLIGAMVIPPALSALLSIPVALHTGRWRLAGRGLFATALTLALAVLTAWLTAVFLLTFSLLPDADSFLSREIIKDRVTVGLYAYVVALASGVAGGFSLVTNRPSQLVGVMISAALIPSAATMGLGLAQHNHAIVRGALSLIGVNVALIVLGGFLALVGLRVAQGLRQPAT